MTHAFRYDNPYASARSPVFARDVVATSHPLAAQAGLQMLRRGGNAVDAAVATAAVMTLVEPCSNGLGSDAFALVWDGQRLQGLNASGRAPAAWTPDYFQRRYGEAAKAPPVRGWDAVTVPGAVSAWVALNQRFGRLGLGEVLAPAIELAQRGSAVPPVVQQKWAAAAQVPELVRQPGFAQAFLPRGRAPAVGEHFALPGAARALQAIADTAGAAFYGGEIAQALAAHAAAHGGAMTVADLAAFQPEWVQPLAMPYRASSGDGWALHQLPPNGQGLAALMALGIVREACSARGLDLAALAGGRGADAVAVHHLQIEAMKLAFADVYRHVAEPQAMALSPQALLDAGYLAERARLIDLDRAQLFAAGSPDDVHRRGGTIYLCCADASGLMVSFIQSNYMGFGSGVVLPEWGLSLQNRGHGFSLEAGSPNRVAPGKRPFHTIIPGFLTRHGQPQMAFGVMGANMQPQGQLQTLLRMLDFGQQPQAACDAPRWRFDHGLTIDLEAQMDPELAAGLAARGHRVATLVDSYQDFGAGQFIWRLGEPSSDGYLAASDGRRDGAAIGW